LEALVGQLPAFLWATCTSFKCLQNNQNTPKNKGKTPSPPAVLVRHSIEHVVGEVGPCCLKQAAACTAVAGIERVAAAAPCCVPSAARPGAAADAWAVAPATLAPSWARLAS